MKTNLAVATVLAGIVFLTGEVFSQERGRHHRGRHMMRHRLEALDLSSEQKTKLKSLRADGQKEIAQLQADVKIARIELGEAMHEPTIKQADVNKAVDKLNTARSKMTTIRVNNMVEMSKILTPEQREKMKEMRPAGRGRRGGWGMRHRGEMGRGMGGELGIDHSSGRI